MKNMIIKPTSANRICEFFIYFENLEVFEVYTNSYILYIEVSVHGHEIFTKAVINLWVPYNAGNFLTS